MIEPSVPTPLAVTVKRSQWLRGEGAGNSSLLRPGDGKMCCLGFACRAAGLNRDEIFNRPFPNETDVSRAPALFPLVSNRLLMMDIGTQNDRLSQAEAWLPLLTDTAREASLIALAVKVNIAFTFED